MKEFDGRTLLIITKHGKEEVLKSILTEKLKVNCVVIENFDTDQYGMFSGEKMREDDPLSTLRRKCTDALKRTPFDLAIASEGSFGPHPYLPFAHANEELVMLIDQKNSFEFVGKEMNTETNFFGQRIQGKDQFMQFLKRVHYPSHGVILKDQSDNPAIILKDFENGENLFRSFDKLIKTNGSVYAETDMRAYQNPTRMKNIKRAAEKLIKLIEQRCPSCETPGFAIKSAQDGLPCSLCGSATRSILSHTYRCSSCNYEQIEMHPNGKTAEDPMYCDTCNP